MNVIFCAKTKLENVICDASVFVSQVTNHGSLKNTYFTYINLGIQFCIL